MKSYFDSVGQIIKSYLREVVYLYVLRKQLSGIIFLENYPQFLKNQIASGFIFILISILKWHLSLYVRSQNFMGIF